MARTRARSARISHSRLLLGTFPLIVALVLLAAVPGAAARDEPRQAPKLSKDWKRAQSANFAAVGNTSEGTLRLVLSNLEAFRWAFVQMFPSVRLAAPAPSTVVVFKDWESFTRFQPRDEKGKREENVAGYFMATPTVNYMVMGAQGDESDFAQRVVFHEFTHYILHRNVPDIPIWIDEGLAEYYSTLKIEKERLIIGRAPEYRLQLLRDAPLLPVEQMLSTQATFKIFQNDNDTMRFYAEAWGLVHYLTLGEKGKRQKQISAYVSALQRGAKIDEAFTTAFACTYRDLEKELRDYVNKFQFPALAVPIPAGIGGNIGRAEPLTEMDAEALQADLLVRAGASVDAEKRLNALLAQQPGHAAARLSLAQLRLQQDRRADAVAILRDLVRSDAGDFGAHVYLAPALVEMGEVDEAIRASERATVLNPESPAAWSGLALAAVVADRTGQADAAMTRLQQLDPTANHYQSRAYSAFRFRKDAAALRDASAFIRRAGWGDEGAPYIGFLAALAYRRLGQAADADAVLGQVRAVVERNSWTEKVLDYFQGKLPPDTLLQQAKDDGQRTEAHTYVGFHDLFAGRREPAIAHFRWVKERGSRSFVEYPLAVAELERLEKAAPVQ